MHQVHFCSGSVFTTGDDIAMSLLRFVQAVSAARQSDVVTVPTVSPTGAPASVTLMVNGVSQISAESREHHGPDLEDAAFVARLDARTRSLTTTTAWLGEDDRAIA